MRHATTWTVQFSSNGQIGHRALDLATAGISDETELARQGELQTAKAAPSSSKNARKKRVQNGSSGSSGPSVQNLVETAFEIEFDPVRLADLSIASEILFNNSLAEHRFARQASRQRRLLLDNENRQDSRMLSANQTRLISRLKKLMRRKTIWTKIKKTDSVCLAKMDEERQLRVEIDSTLNTTMRAIMMENTETTIMKKHMDKQITIQQSKCHSKTKLKIQRFTKELVE